MICRNCKFSLQGSEKFCPNCGAPLTEKETEVKSEEVSLPQTPPIFFSPVKEELHSASESPPDEKEEKESISEKKEGSRNRKKDKSSSKAPAALMLLILLLVLITGLFVAVEHFDLAPAIMQYLNEDNTSPSDVTSRPDSAAVNFDNGQSVLSPDINYSPTQAYIARDNSLPLRKGPDDSYGLIMNLETGLQLQILGGTNLTDLWVYVYVPYHDCYGWICASYITLYGNADYTSLSKAEESTVPTEESTQDTATEPSTSDPQETSAPTV